MSRSQHLPSIPRIARVLGVFATIAASTPTLPCAFAWQAPARVANNDALLQGIARRPGEPRWRHIVIHHTAAESSSLTGVDRYHRRRFSDPLGIEYHFLIGNGRAATDGLIQLGRWQHRARSIHAVHPERAPDAITICLVGNLHTRRPSAAQMLATEQLVRRLMQLYAIPWQRVTTHTRVDGRFSVCPGKKFPIGKLRARLAAKRAVAFKDWIDPGATFAMFGPYWAADGVTQLSGWARCNGKPSANVTVGKRRQVAGLGGAQLVTVEGRDGCVPAVARFVVIEESGRFWAAHLNGYRKPRLKTSGRGQVVVRDARGPMLRCARRAGRMSCTVP